MGPPPPPITVTGGGGAGWELPVPGLACGTALVRFGAAGSWLPSSPETAGEVPPGDSALPVTAMRQEAGLRVSRGVRRAGAGVARPGRTGRRRSALRPDGDPGQAGAGPWEAGPTRSLPCVALPPSEFPGRGRTLGPAGPGAEAETSAEPRRGTAQGRRADNAASGGPRCASGAGRCARGRVCMCASVSQR